MSEPFPTAESMTPELWRSMDIQAICEQIRRLSMSFMGGRPVIGRLYNRVVDDDGRSCRSSFPHPFLADGSANPEYVSKVDALMVVIEDFGENYARAARAVQDVEHCSVRCEPPYWARGIGQALGLPAEDVVNDFERAENIYRPNSVSAQLSLADDLENMAYDVRITAWHGRRGDTWQGMARPGQARRSFF
ncbi:MAG: hypothetical protein OEQ18_01630 [Gammaproteobacteria bacterium]|nr:hypothetical protein [Gammaproteobacteria bacterium]